ncbi:hypothetical protein O181_066853 [Austropuccinia psidii MF-1]|uniref:Uncharacterized protein n=1 Tax=Austropuccinia psidii MF-1 TaxID=1389203 RepID=A0A9Q3I3Z5_9BASI|nr:hypothetical protein [Austropuccinia psidii MF-1]
MTDACDACQQAHKKCLFFLRTTRPRGQRSSRPRRPCEDSFVANDDETISKREWTPEPQAGQRERFWTISPVPSSIDLSTPPPMPPFDGHFTPRPEQSDYLANEGWRWQEDIRLWVSFSSLSHLSSHNNTDFFPLLIEQNPPNPPNKTLLFLVCLASKPRSSPLRAQVAPDEPSQTKEPPIPGPSPSSQPHKDNMTHEPEPEVAPMQSREEPFAIIHKSINRILREHRRLLHMIPFVDATHRNEMHREFWEEPNSLLAQALEAYPKEDITGIVSKFLEK